ncbi:MAG: helix-turn-helix domain-containing protein [Pseudomonadales bacterium]|nr:helix-turn-helix domain-containing protein [Pseudomonadales bacterium]
MDTVRGWAQTNTIPTVKVGRQRLINLEELIKDLRNGKKTFQQGDYGEKS